MLVGYGITFWYPSRTCEDTLMDVRSFSVSGMSAVNAMSAPAEAARADGRDDSPLCTRDVRDDADRAADGVTAEQGALRALEDLDAVDVQQVLVRADRAREVHAVEVDADAGVEVEGEVVLPDTADGRGEHRAVTGEGRAGVEVDVRRDVRQRLDVVQALAPAASGPCRRKWQWARPGRSVRGVAPVTTTSCRPP